MSVGKVPVVHLATEEPVPDVVVWPLYQGLQLLLRHHLQEVPRGLGEPGLDKFFVLLQKRLVEPCSLLSPSASVVGADGGALPGGVISEQ